jgi:hypothetical protein
LLVFCDKILHVGLSFRELERKVRQRKYSIRVEK